MRFAPLACAVAAALAAAAPARAQVESGRVNVHLNLALGATPSALGLAGNVGVDWQFVAPLALDANVSAGGLGLLAGSGSDPVIFAVTAGLRYRFVDRPGGDGYLVPRAGYLLDRNDNSSYATVHLEAGAEFTADGPVRLGPFVQVAGAFGPSNFVYFMVGINLSAVAVQRASPKPRPMAPTSAWRPREDEEGDDRDAAEPPPPVAAAPPPPVVLAPQMVLEGVTFALDSADIQPASEAALARAAQLLRDHPSARVEVAGHTCDLGSDEYNMKLSQARAAAVADWLVAHGIDRARLQVRGYGNTQPKVANDSEANRALNRRIEFRRLDE